MSFLLSLSLKNSSSFFFLSPPDSFYPVWRSTTHCNTHTGGRASQSRGGRKGERERERKGKRFFFSLALSSSPPARPTTTPNRILIPPLPLLLLLPRCERKGKDAFSPSSLSLPREWEGVRKSRKRRSPLQQRAMGRWEASTANEVQVTNKESFQRLI